MANRSYLYAYNQDPEFKITGLSEWNYEIPLLHKILMGGSPEIVGSRLWEVKNQPTKMAIKGNFAQGYELLMTFMGWLKKEIKKEEADFAKEYDIMEKFFHDKIDYQFTWLEPGEVYMINIPSEDFEAETELLLSDIKSIGEEIERLKNLSAEEVLSQSSIEEIKNSPNTWQDIGMYWSDFLYYEIVSDFDK